jgi:7,8-dihydropterin-6-yl-methyl-4-(beta-D-ribofuranosyl)aminobenzene 5'-phosphate synthase
MNFTVTTLVENTVTAGIAPLMAEHGLSFFIETGERRILSDTGQGLALLGNADALGIDLRKIDTVVLSHGHFDHAGGVKNLLSRNTDFTLVAHPDVFDDKLAGLGGNYFSAGTPELKELLVKAGINLSLQKDSIEIAPNVRTTGEIPQKTDFEDVEKMFFIRKDNHEIPDSIPDDNALILDTEKGTVVVLGCAHRGLINTLDHVVDITGNKTIHAVMGGLHLLYADELKLKKIFGRLHDFGLEKMIIGHCTGFQATAALWGEFGIKVIPNTVGHKIEF